MVEVVESKLCDRTYGLSIDVLSAFPGICIRCIATHCLGCLRNFQVETVLGVVRSLLLKRGVVDRGNISE